MPPTVYLLATFGVASYSQAIMILTNFTPVTRRAAVIAAGVILVGCATAPYPTPAPRVRGETTVYIVRHAEKSPVNPADPELSAAGYIRADSLATQLREAGIDVIITSHLKRTGLTARPLARMLQLTPQVVQVTSPVAAHADSVAAAVRRHAGARILVVGHSNTVGRIVEALGGGRVGDLCDNEYSNLFILTMSRSAPTRFIIERYGPPDPPGDGSCKPMRAQ